MKTAPCAKCEMVLPKNELCLSLRSRDRLCDDCYNACCKCSGPAPFVLIDRMRLCRPCSKPWFDVKAELVAQARKAFLEPTLTKETTP